MEYRDKKFQNIAELLGAKNDVSSDGDLLKHILMSEGLIRCFGIAHSSCTHMNCLLWEECKRYNSFVRYLC
jgi:hypothetical protein